MKNIVRSTSLIVSAVMVALLLVPVAGAKMRRFSGASPAAWQSSIVVGGSRTLLPDGRLLIAGGQDSSGRVQTTLSTVDPITGETIALESGLRFARAAHTATVLPDGTVLIFGGVGQDGKLVPSAELFDPVSGAVRVLPTPAPVARAFHTATLLTEGRVLIAGGVFSNGTLAGTVELWDPRGENTVILSPQVTMPRRNHTANLLPDGRVLFSGGPTRAAILWRIIRSSIPSPKLFRLQPISDRSSSPMVL